jgi:hypothetical protein
MKCSTFFSILIHLITILLWLSCCCECRYGCSDHIIRTISILPTKRVTHLCWVYTNDIHPTRRLHGSHSLHSTLNHQNREMLPSSSNKKLQRLLLQRREQDMTFHVFEDANDIVDNQTQLFLLHYDNRRNNNNEINNDFEYWNTIGIPIAGVTVLMIMLLLGIVSPPMIITNLLLFVLLRTIANQLILYDDDYDDNSNEDRNLKEIDNEMKFSQWQVDATTFIFSFFTAITLIPSTISTDLTISDSSTGRIVPDNLFVVASVAIIPCIGIWFNTAIVSRMIQEEQLTFQEFLFKQWDQKFMQFVQQKKNQQNDTDQK